MFLFFFLDIFLIKIRILLQSLLPKRRWGHLLGLILFIFKLVQSTLQQLKLLFQVLLFILWDIFRRCYTCTTTIIWILMGNCFIGWWILCSSNFLLISQSFIRNHLIRNLDHSPKLPFCNFCKQPTRPRRSKFFRSFFLFLYRHTILVLSV